MIEYNKIETIFKRDMEGSKKLIDGIYRNETIEFLKDCEWIFTEKIDGTNIRVYWDGHKITFGGRTDNSQIPANLINRLNELFGGETNAQIFEEKFGATEVILFGEGFGGNIQGNLGYKDMFDFILFDVMINKVFLETSNCQDIAKSFGIDYVPIIIMGTIEEAIQIVKSKPKSVIGNAQMEGLVGRTKIELQDKQGKRIIVKIKVRDFENI